MYQIQGQLHITNVDYCYFIVWTPLGLLYQKIDKNYAFWNNMQRKLLSFFYNCLLPELVDPRHTRGLEIRNNAR